MDALMQAALQASLMAELYTEQARTSLAQLEDSRHDAKRLDAEILCDPLPDGKQDAKEAREQLKGKVDAVWLIPEPASTGPQALADTMEFARARHLPVLGASSGNVRNGALLALSANLQDLGDNTAEMAAHLLDGSASP